MIAISSGFPSLNLNWLMSGTGTMYMKPIQPSLDIDRIATLVDTIANLQTAISAKNEIIETLTSQLKQYESQLKQK